VDYWPIAGLIEVCWSSGSVVSYGEQSELISTILVIFGTADMLKCEVKQNQKLWFPLHFFRRNKIKAPQLLWKKRKQTDSMSTLRLRLTEVAAQLQQMIDQEYTVGKHRREFKFHPGTWKNVAFIHLYRAMYKNEQYNL